MCFAFHTQITACSFNSDDLFLRKASKKQCGISMKEAEEQIPHQASGYSMWRYLTLLSGGTYTDPKNLRCYTQVTGGQSPIWGSAAAPHVLPVHTNSLPNCCIAIIFPPTFNPTRDPGTAEVLMWMLEWEGTDEMLSGVRYLSIYLKEFLYFCSGPQDDYIGLSAERQLDSHKCPSLASEVMFGWIHPPLSTLLRHLT